MMKLKNHNGFLPFFGTRGMIRSQLVLALGSVSLLTILGLAIFLYEQQRVFLYQAALQQTQAFAAALASSSVSWVLANDLAGLHEVVQGFEGIPNLQRAYVLSLEGEVLASTRQHEMGLFVKDAQSLKLLLLPAEPQVLLANTRQIDLAVPVMAEQRHVAWARVEMTMQQVSKNLHAILVAGVEFIVFASLLVLLVAMLLANRLTRRLHHLISVVHAIEQGRREQRARLIGRDEVAVLATSFNQMLDTLAVSERKREQITRLYAAWTESIDLIVREADEHRLFRQVCAVITKHVEFKLVWVGIVEDDGWLRVEACSPPNSAYLRQAKVSIAPERPGGAMGLAIRLAMPQIFNDFQNEPLILPWRDAAIEDDIHSVAAFPLIRSGQCIGAIGLYSGEVGYFTEELIALVRGITDDLCYALDNIDREQQRLFAEQQLRIAAAAFESQEGIIVTDESNLILRVNRAFSELTGYSPDEVMGQKPSILKSCKQDQAFYETMWQHIVHDKYWQGELWNRRKNGELYPVWLCVTALVDDDDKITHYVGSFNDISQRKADEERIRSLAFYDPLTRLPNRTLLFERLTSAFGSSKRSGHHGALMFLDLDNFKTLNDTLGHDFGDQLLIEVAKRLLDSVRETDTVARFGGDEFVIVLENLSESVVEAVPQAQIVAEKIRQILTEPYALFNEIAGQSPIDYHASGSIGFALFLGQETSYEELLKRADLAMYQAKQAGRNAIRSFVPQMQAALNARAALEADLRHALERNELVLFFQIQVDATAYPVGAEALVRWYQTERGLVAPEQFMQLAEESNLIVPIGYWMLRCACETLVQWSLRPELRHLHLSLNMSGHQLAQSDFVEQVQMILKDTQVNPSLLKLEITESTILENVDDIVYKMHALRALGVGFSMDDFGSGYSSLSYLQKLPLEQIKIDAAFVKNIAVNPQDAAIIRTILALGQNLTLNIVADGVEDHAQLGYLTHHGCSAFQGYLFGQPLALDEFEQQLLAILACHQHDALENQR